jgi:hypothetical protein
MTMVSFPRLARLLVSDTAPQVDDVLASVKGAARSTDFASANKVLSEHLAHGLEAWADVPLNTEAVGRRRTDDGAGWGHTFCDHAASFIFLEIALCAPLPACRHWKALAYTLFMSDTKVFL